MKRLFRRQPLPELQPEVEDSRPCPHCGEQISRGATVCMFCEEPLAPLMSYAEFASRFGHPHSGGPPHVPPGGPEKVD